MNMKNVAQMVAILGMFEDTKHDSIPVALAAEVFGSDENCVDVLEKAYKQYDNLTEEQFATTYGNMLKECLIALKNDFEADTLLDKEDAS